MVRDDVSSLDGGIDIVVKEGEMKKLMQHVEKENYTIASAFLGSAIRGALCFRLLRTRITNEHFTE